MGIRPLAGVKGLCTVHHIEAGAMSGGKPFVHGLDSAVDGRNSFIIDSDIEYRRASGSQNVLDQLGCKLFGTVDFDTPGP